MLDYSPRGSGVHSLPYLAIYALVSLPLLYSIYSLYRRVGSSWEEYRQNVHEKGDALVK